MYQNVHLEAFKKGHLGTKLQGFEREGENITLTSSTSTERNRRSG